MTDPRYAIPQTREDRFQEAYDRASFESSLEAGEICVHGWEAGKCKEGCNELETAV